MDPRDNENSNQLSKLLGLMVQLDRAFNIPDTIKNLIKARKVQANPGVFENQDASKLSEVEVKTMILHSNITLRVSAVMTKHGFSGDANLEDFNKKACTDELQKDLEEIIKLSLSSDTLKEEYVQLYQYIMHNLFEKHGVDADLAAFKKYSQSVSESENKETKIEREEAFQSNPSVMKRLFGEPQNNKTISELNQEALDRLFNDLDDVESKEVKIDSAEARQEKSSDYFKKLPLDLQSKIMGLSGNLSLTSRSVLGAGFFKPKEADTVMKQHIVGWKKQLAELYGYERTTASDHQSPEKILMFLVKTEQRNRKYFYSVYMNYILPKKPFPALENISLPDSTSMNERVKIFNQAALLGNLELMQWLSSPDRGDFSVPVSLPSLENIIKSGSTRAIKWGIQELGLTETDLTSQLKWGENDVRLAYSPQDEEASGLYHAGAIFDDDLFIFSQDKYTNMPYLLLRLGNVQLLDSLHINPSYSILDFSDIVLHGQLEAFQWYLERFRDEIVRDVNLKLVAAAAESGNNEIYVTIRDMFALKNFSASNQAPDFLNAEIKQAPEENFTFNQPPALGEFFNPDQDWFEPARQSLTQEDYEKEMEQVHRVLEQMDPANSLYTLLESAIRGKNMEIIEQVATAEPNKMLQLSDERRERLIRVAALGGNPQVFDWALNTFQINLNQDAAMAKTCLNYAANSGNVQLMIDLIEKYHLKPDQETVRHAAGSLNINSVAWLTSEKRGELRVVPTPETIDKIKSPVIKAFLHEQANKPRLAP